MLDTLSRMGRALNDAGVLWCVGGSMLLSQYGLAEHPNDLDLLVRAEDWDKAAELLGAMGETLPCPRSGIYATERFMKLQIGGVGVDLMAGFAINHPEGRYEYAFDGDSVASRREIGGVSIPFAALEDWYVAYQLIPGKGEKAARIGEYLRSNGLRRPHLLERALQGSLPETVRAGASALLARA